MLKEIFTIYTSNFSLNTHVISFLTFFTCNFLHLKFSIHVKKKNNLNS